jgi:hypothetical protein
MAQLCQFDLEQSFLALQMAQGSNGDFSVASFMNFYWGEMAKQIGEDVELLRWQGDTASEDDTLALCDGYIKKMKADTGIIDVAKASITSSNVIAEIVKVINALPSTVSRKKADLRLYVASNIANALELATASGNTQTYITTPLALTFLGIKVVVAEGMPNNHMVATVKNNMIYAFDGEGDGKAIKAVNLADTVAEPYLRSRANLKVGFSYVNPTEIVLYS